MSPSALRALWRRALEAADNAVEAGRRAEILRRDFCAAQLVHLRDERDWLAHVDWTRL